MTTLKRYVLNLLIALDQLGNTIAGGDPDETISSRLGKWKHHHGDSWRHVFAWIVCRLLHRLDPEHCKKSIEMDEGKDGVIK